ncbi:hypothetical protein BCR33DRAFT_721521 [Rhizoclosmatium globosum]|uniref:Uncharacterized protein n=1 Tax=Rhizoclosmatium globosum TaxID=329046 RepID=A0A1Y2BRT2_9FUNG|nr:hypothetical protein BCR33DRAFT_721521 [Rhizoclosmatium globosum]|eukprot:ORY37471.1 hypothetical protein BCR33DRAFT_721521 [Rhizoclosmatium globosum]
MIGREKKGDEEGEEGGMRSASNKEDKDGNDDDNQDKEKEGGAEGRCLIPIEDCLRYHHFSLCFGKLS